MADEKKIKRHKINCRMCSKFIYRKDITDSICDVCYIPDGDEADLSSMFDDDTTEKIKTQLRDIIRTTHSYGLPKPNIKIKSEDGEREILAYPPVADCAKAGIALSNNKPDHEKVLHFKKYMDECIKQLQEIKEIFNIKQ